MGKLRCSATTKAGKPCPHYAAPGATVCPMHDREGQAERGRKGAEAKHANERARRVAEAEQLRTISLQTAEQMRAALERALAAVEASGASEIARANATARLVAEARQIAGHLDLQKQLEELRALVIERIPGAAARLSGGVH